MGPERQDAASQTEAVDTNATTQSEENENE